MIPNLIGDRARSVGLPAVKRVAGIVTRLLPIPQPTLMVGPGSSARLGQAVGGFGHRQVLIVTDEVISRLGLLEPLTDALAAGGTPFTVFDEVTADAPIPVIEKGIAVFRRAGCDAIVAFVAGYIAENGFSPSLREIAAACGMGSNAVAEFHLDRLVRDGRITRKPGIARTYRVPAEAR